MKRALGEKSQPKIGCRQFPKAGREITLVPKSSKILFKRNEDDFGAAPIKQVYTLTTINVAQRCWGLSGIQPILKGAKINISPLSLHATYSPCKNEIETTNCCFVVTKRSLQVDPSFPRKLLPQF